MDMKVKSNVIIAQRNARAWSQSQLADICDVSLRTIQRIEKHNSASQESTKAIASAFNINVEDLLLVDTQASPSNSSAVHNIYKRKFAALGLAFSVMLVIGISILLPSTTVSAKPVEVMAKKSQTNASTNQTLFSGDVIVTFTKQNILSTAGALDAAFKEHPNNFDTELEGLSLIRFKHGFLSFTAGRIENIDGKFIISAQSATYLIEG